MTFFIFLFATLGMIRAVLIFNNHGKPRLMNWFIQIVLFYLFYFSTSYTIVQQYKGNHTGRTLKHNKNISRIFTDKSTVVPTLFVISFQGMMSLDKIQGLFTDITLRCILYLSWIPMSRNWGFWT